MHHQPDSTDGHTSRKTKHQDIQKKNGGNLKKDP